MSSAPESTIAAGWNIKASNTAKNTHNPIRKIVENIKMPKDHPKAHIPLSLGDPTVYGNFKAPEVLVKAVQDALVSEKANGYIHSAGTAPARVAIAKKYSYAKSPLTENDVVIGSGCSGALDLAITALLNPGDILLVPQPAFSLYATLCHSKGIEIDEYKLIPERSWEVDIAHLHSLFAKHGSRIGAVLFNNPSNPCGSVFSKEHTLDLLKAVEEHKVPIIADEIYGNLVFPSSGSQFFSFAELSENVPVLQCGGLAKEFLVPGWRVGWVCIHDRHGLFAPIRTALFALSQLILGANSLVVSAIPAVLDPLPGSADEKSLEAFHKNTLAQLEENAVFSAAKLAEAKGIEVIVPQGAMYVMFKVCADKFKDIKTDVEFSQLLLDEENVFVLPGACFNMHGFCRVVFTAPLATLEDAYERIKSFCERHIA